VHLLPTKEEIIKNTEHDELWCLFHTFIWRLNDIRNESDKIVVLDKELDEVVQNMKRDYS